MTVQALLDEARRLGITLEAHGPMLHIDAPAGALTPELRADLATHKPALLALVAPVTEFISLKGGLTLPRLALEARGFQMSVDSDQHVVIEPAAALTPADRASFQRWQGHLAAILSYQCPRDEFPQ